MGGFAAMLKTLLPVIVAGFAAACSSTSAPDQSPGPIFGGGPTVVLTVVFPGHASDTLHVVITDSATIAQAERYVNTGVGPGMLSGRIARGAGYDARYPFHYIAESVRLVDAAMELCDGAPMHSDAEVTQFFISATGSATSDSAPWCPWGSRPIALTRLLPA